MQRLRAAVQRDSQRDTDRCESLSDFVVEDIWDILGTSPSTAAGSSWQSAIGKRLIPIAVNKHYQADGPTCHLSTRKVTRIESRVAQPNAVRASL
jgi:hypothetical protein